MKKRYNLYILLLTLFVLGCKNDKSEEKVEQNKETIKVLEKPKILSEKESKIILQKLEIEQESTLITQAEFNNFKLKSNYIEAIEKYDENNKPLPYFRGTEEDKLRYYPLPTEVNAKQYESNSFVFGDLNNDGMRDCIVTAVRSNMYDEVHFFYIFINNGNLFKLIDVACEDDLSGCKNGGWPSSFRYQKIEDGVFKGITFCHYNDAHCCPSLVFKCEAKFVESKLQFYKADFVFQDYQYILGKLEFELDSVLFKSRID
ncbi:MAG: hypothetical protein GQ540_12005 [Lutibacter sp.]|uniref:hypothetical protein n=1 Tax=Lutibacter sp. TaxID=1925666 RepID=UPI0019DC1781|nr:hypothetical protein [Lutibacter sp.]NOR29241.1 hypothetical protein [Lutibacter sp.]